MKKNKGFTIVELLIVIIVMGTIAAIIIPFLSVALDKQESDNTSMNNTIQEQETVVEEKESVPTEPEMVNEQEGDMKKL